MYATLGDIKFEGVRGFTDLNHKLSANYAEHAIIDGKPKLQRVADNLDEVSISVRLHVAFCNPEVELKKFVDAMRDGTVLPFINGAGDVYGDFVIASVEKDNQALDKDGRIVELMLSMELKEFYSADLVRDREEKAKSSALALSQNNPIPVQPVTTPQTETLEASQSVTTAVAEAETVDYNAYVAMSDPAEAEKPLSDMQEALNNMDTAFDNVLTKINAFTGDLYDKTRLLDSTINSAKVKIDDLRNIGNTLDFVNLIPGAQALQASINNVKSANATLTAIIATRRWRT